MYQLKYVKSGIHAQSKLLPISSVTHEVCVNPFFFIYITTSLVAFAMSKYSDRLQTDDELNCP